MIPTLCRYTLPALICLILFSAVSANAEDASSTPEPEYNERPHDRYLPPAERRTTPAQRWRRGPHVSIQVNVDADGNNILNDAANEPSIAVDPNQPQRMAIGWRQFDNIRSNFRQAGVGFSTDGGRSWTAGVIEPGVFRSDPVLTYDGSGTFYYNSITLIGSDFQSDLFRSDDSGATWDKGVYATGGDKHWLAIDRTQGIGAGHLYQHWNVFGSCCGGDNFARSVDGGDTFGPTLILPEQFMLAGTSDVGPDGEVYVSGRRLGFTLVAKSTTLKDPSLPPAFDFLSVVPTELVASGSAINPDGIPGQVWVVVDSTNTLRRGWVYALATVVGPGSTLDLELCRSTDGGKTWSPPVRINDDALGNAIQWFGTMAIAPNGRLDVVWNDTRNSGGTFDSELFYAFSLDGGATWSPNRPVSPSFDPQLGWPNQKKIGDYYDMISHDDGVHVAYAATFNGEQDVYYLHIVPQPEVFADGFESGDVASWSGSSVP